MLKAMPVLGNLSSKQRNQLLIGGLCLFIFALSFKPSEPYLTEFLVCNKDTQQDYCSFSNENDCNASAPCVWSGSACTVLPCEQVDYSSCGNDDYDYCYQDHGSCSESRCYKHFSADQVNNEIYPWASYAYLPFLLGLGPLAEVFSYRGAILYGILGRVATRVLLLYGRSLLSMQLMQVAYALGTAAEDVFFAYVYYVVSAEQYQSATSHLKASALLACVLSGALGDALVFLGLSLYTLTWISAVSVFIGFLIGLVALAKPSAPGAAEEVDGPAPEEVLPWRERHRRKMDMFRWQLQCLHHAMQCTPLRAMLCLWVSGNAVFYTIYSYEVSIYEELYGSNLWNGSVLAATLLAGTAGAMLPSLMPAATANEELTAGSRTLLALLLCCVSLVLAVWTWSLLPSISCLAVFFAAWQFINAIAYARLAIRLKTAQQYLQGDSKAPLLQQEEEAEPPFSMAVVAIVAANVLLQITMQAVLFSYLQLPLRTACWVMTAVFLAAAGCYALHCMVLFGPRAVAREWCSGGVMEGVSSAASAADDDMVE